jgi:hypothetical protein
LIKEAIKRGYKNGNYKCLLIPSRTHITGHDFIFHKDELRLFCRYNLLKGQNVIFKDGKWAEIIESEIIVNGLTYVLK